MTSWVDWQQTRSEETCLSMAMAAQHSRGIAKVAGEGSVVLRESLLQLMWVHSMASPPGPWVGVVCSQVVQRWENATPSKERPVVGRTPDQFGSLPRPTTSSAAGGCRFAFRVFPVPSRCAMCDRLKYAVAFCGCFLIGERRH